VRPEYSGIRDCPAPFERARHSPWNRDDDLDDLEALVLQLLLDAGGDGVEIEELVAEGDQPPAHLMRSSVPRSQGRS
jgi:hypothetical protein